MLRGAVSALRPALRGGAAAVRAAQGQAAALSTVKDQTVKLTFIDLDVST
jgi:hypothetical protein